VTTSHAAIPPDPAIVVDGVTKRYGRTTALDEVSLAVPAGSVFALLGHNGAGKTTLVRVLTTLVRPDSGTASVAGHDVVAQASEVRDSVALVGQHTAVDDYLTGRENLLLIARLLRMCKAERAQRIGATLGRFGLLDVADQPASTYSGGMRRRLDIAVTLLSDPAVIFLDEPTTGLDPVSRRDVWHLIEELAAAGTTIVTTTQYLEEADQLADSIGVVDQGHLIATGTPDDLKARLGGDSVRVQLRDIGRVRDAVDVLTTAVGSATAVDGATVELDVTNGASTLPNALRYLHDAGVDVTAAEVRRPALDDVFFALTGQRAGEPANVPSLPPVAQPAPVQAGSTTGHRRRPHARSHR
jgi:ABC-2 type transport system ATP-binding protein